jgi:hypothetical protein
MYAGVREGVRREVFIGEGGSDEGCTVCRGEGESEEGCMQW